MNTKPRSDRPCAICQSVRVRETKICDECVETWGSRLDEEWAREMVRISDDLSRILRMKRAKETTLWESPLFTTR